MTRNVGKQGGGLVLVVVMALCVALVTAGCTTAPATTSDQPAVQPAMLDGTSSADLDAAVARIREFTDFQPRVGVVLGSGLGGLADQTDVVATIPYAEIEGFPSRRPRITMASTSSATWRVCPWSSWTGACTITRATT